MQRGVLRWVLNVPWVRLLEDPFVVVFSNFLWWKMSNAKKRRTHRTMNPYLPWVRPFCWRPIVQNHPCLSYTVAISDQAEVKVSAFMYLLCQWSSNNQFMGNLVSSILLLFPPTQLFGAYFWHYIISSINISVCYL